jgi:hypothetical protein
MAFTNEKAPQVVATAYEAIMEFELMMRVVARDLWTVEMALPADRRCKKWKPRKAVGAAAQILDEARTELRDRAAAMRRVRRVLDRAEWLQPSDGTLRPEQPARGGNGHAMAEPRSI